MNANTELINKATAHIVKVMTGEAGVVWDGARGCSEYMGVCGWNGVMSPLNRSAFVEKFGEDFTALVEGKAREELAKRAAFWDNSKAKQHEAQADGIESAASLNVGMFIWGVTSGLKCDHGSFKHSIENMLWLEDKHPDDFKKQLCRIDRIEEVEDLDTLDDGWLGQWKPQGNEGGSGSDDVTEEEVGKWGANFSQLTAEQKRTFYTVGVLVRDRKGKYLFIDPEGYDYVRYLYFPLGWKEMFKDKFEAVVAEREARAARVAAAKAKEEAEARAAYDARCAKWERIMTPATPQQWGVDTKTGRKNVLAMAKAAFPWVRFWVSYSSRWGHGYTLKWTNGPTVEEMKAATDFGLFKPSKDTFDGMTDSSDVEYARFTDFADKFGGVRNGVEFDRQTAEKDLNRNPVKEAPKPSVPVSGDLAEVRENAVKNGIEIYFPSVPSEAIREEMKSCGFRWSRFAKAWYSRATEENRTIAAKIAEKFNKERAAA